MQNQSQDLRFWKPSQNYLDSLKSLKEIDKHPAKEQGISLKNKLDKVKAEGLTFISEAFDCARRSWHLKLDIDQTFNISVWLVERGPPLNPDPLFFRPSPIEFSSLLLEFWIKDGSGADRSSLIYFSFAHEKG